MIGMCKGVIYRHWLVNECGEEKSYIGKHNSMEYEKKRWKKNGIGYKPHKGKPYTTFWSMIQKYGWNNFNHDIVEVIECETQEELNDVLNNREIYWIAYYDSYNNGFNGTKGGDGFNSEIAHKIATERWSNEENRRKQSENSKNAWTEERKQEWSQLVSGENNPMYGRKGEQNPFYGKHHTDESKKKNSDSQKRLYENGYTNPNKGKTMSDEQKDKISNTRKEKGIAKGENNPRARKVICLNTLEVFGCIVDGANWCMVSRMSVTRCCKGQANTGGKHPITGEKLRWMYYDEYLEMIADSKAEDVA